MSSTIKTRCYFKSAEQTFGPADCEITENVAVAAHGTTHIEWYGTFMLDPAAKPFPFPFMSSEVDIFLEDGRSGPVHFTKTLNGTSGEFRIQGDLDKTNI